MDLGEYTHCLNVQDLASSIDFYTKLGFVLVADHRSQKWAVLEHNNLTLSLFEGHIERNLLNFRGGDVAEIAAELKTRGLSLHQAAQVESDGSWSAELIDPDGNRIYFNTFAEERSAYLKKRTSKPVQE